MGLWQNGLSVMAERVIKIVGARQHNLKGIDLEIPRERLVVITGPSGSGKSSLAFDTVFAEGQRKYVESLSVYARQFLDQLGKPDVDMIEGLSPAIAIEQRVSGGSPRSTIATSTEIYDFLRVLYASVGIPHEPSSGRVLEKKTPQEMVEALLALPSGTRVMVLAAVVERERGEFRDVMEKLRREGFVRARIDGEVIEIDGVQLPRLDKKQEHTIEAVVDRLVLKDGVRSRLADSVETALKWGGKRMVALVQEAGSEEWRQLSFSTDYTDAVNGFRLPTLTARHFSFNSHLGACPACHGIGTQLVCDATLIIPDESLTLEEGAIKPWAKATKRMKAYYDAVLEGLCRAYGAAKNVPYADLPLAFREALLHGTKRREIKIPSRGTTSVIKPFEGLLVQIERQYAETESELARHRLRAYMNRQPCQTCGGRRLRPEILAVTLEADGFGERNIHEFCELPVAEALRFLDGMSLGDQQVKIVADVVREIRARISFLVDVGLGYLCLSRESGTLSGGEAQRIRLATQLGAGLSGVLYVLDEPSIGLHQRDNARLLRTLRRLQELGNTVIVVEHDEETIRAADHIIDLGPGAGPHGGRLVAQGTLEDILSSPESPTGRFLSGRDSIPVPRQRMAPKEALLDMGEEMPRPVDTGWLVVVSATENNLKGVNARIPIGCMTCVTGVSGSGKSTLVDEVLRKALARKLHGAKEKPGAHRQILGIEQIDKMIEIDQTPIGRTPRSNPATYSGALGPVRDLFAQLPSARVRGYDAGRFSFNVKGGRCEACKGDGQIKIEMHFLPDVYVECEQCGGTRYNRETLEITYKGRNIADVLAMTVDEAADFFRNVATISDKLHALQDVGLGYIRLGQPANTLSGGEAQRIKLAAELARKSTGRTVYIFDEPTTGLHFADVQRLLDVLFRLRDAGNTLIVVEHNLDVIKSADWIIDLGPEGGEGGGEIVAEGTPEEVARNEISRTAPYLRELLKVMGVFVAMILMLTAGVAEAAASGVMAAESVGVSEQIERARKAVEDGIAAVAVPLLQDLLNSRLEDAERVEVIRLLARAMIDADNPQEALKVLERLAVPTAQTEFLRGEALAQERRWAEAVQAYEAAREAGFEPAADVTLRLALAHLGAGELAEALSLAKLLEVGEAGSAKLAQLVAAEAHLASGQPSEALQALGDMEPGNVSSPVDKRFVYLAGRAHLVLKQYEEALRFLQPLLEVNQGLSAEIHAGAGLAAAEAFLALGQVDEAESLVTGRIENFPESNWLADYFEILGRIARERENYSTRQLRLWVMDEEHEGRARFSRLLLARELARAGDASQALSFLKPIVQSEGDPMLRLDAVLESAAIMATTDAEVALAMLERESSAWEVNTEGRGRLDFAAAEILISAGRHAEAAERFARAEVVPTLAEQAGYNRAMSWIAAHDDEAFLAAYRDFSERFPESRLRSDLVLEEGLMQWTNGDLKAEKTLGVFLRDFAGHERAAEAKIALAAIALAKSPPDIVAARLLLSETEVGEGEEDIARERGFLEVFLVKLDPEAKSEALIAKIGQYLQQFPVGGRAMDARMMLAEAYFQQGDYARSQAEFEQIAELAESDETAEVAYYLAGDSAVRTLNPETLDRAVELYQSAASFGGKLSYQARLGQARIKFRQGAYEEAVVIYSDILRDEPEGSIRLDAMLGKAEAYLAMQRPDAKAEEAVSLLREIAKSPSASAALRNEALWKAGRALEIAGQIDDALTTYYEGFAETPSAGATLDFFWHDKAAFDAARLLESRQQWQSAIGIYRKIGMLPGPRSEEARTRLDRLRLEHFLWED